MGRRCSTSRPRNCSAQQFLSARLFPHSRLVETGGRRHPRRKAAISRLRSSDLRWRRPKNVSVRAPAKSYSNAEHAFERFRYLRRGARGLRGTALRGRRPLRRAGAPKGRFTGHSGEKPSSSARLGEIISDKLTVYRLDFLLRRGARDFSLHFATQTQQKPLWGRAALEPGLPVATCMVRALELSRSPAGISIDFAYAKRLKSLLRRAGDQRCSATSWNWPQAGRAPRARGERAMLRIAITSCETPPKHPTGAPRRRAHRASYWPDGRKLAEKPPTPGEKHQKQKAGPTLSHRPA